MFWKSHFTVPITEYWVPQGCSGLLLLGVNSGLSPLMGLQVQIRADFCKVFLCDKQLPFVSVFQLMCISDVQ